MMFKIDYDNIYRSYCTHINNEEGCSWCKCYEYEDIFDTYYVILNDYFKPALLDCDGDVIDDDPSKPMGEFIKQMAIGHMDELHCFACPSFEICDVFEDRELDPEQLEEMTAELEALEREKNAERTEVYPL